MKSLLKLRPQEAIEHIASVLFGIDGCVLFATCIDSDGFVADSDCFMPPSNDLDGLPLEYLFKLPLETGNPALMLVSRWPGKKPITHREQLDFTRRLLEASKEYGVDVVDRCLGGLGRLGVDGQNH